MNVSAETFDRCMAAGGVAIFPSDTVYGLACDPGNRVAVERLYMLKRRPLTKPSAIMFFDLELAFESLPELGERARGVLSRLLPGGVTALVANPAERFPLACGEDPVSLGVRVPVVPQLQGVKWPVLQSSANRAGGPDPRRLQDVSELIRAAADLVIDGGELPGIPSTVIDLREYDSTGAWGVLRHGLVGEAELRAVLGGQIHFNPATYSEMIRADIPHYDAFEDVVVAATGTGARRILELGTGTGETARRLLDRHPGAMLVGVDESAAMLDAARAALPADRVELVHGGIEATLPPGPFDLVASALCVHHLDGVGKASLFARAREVLRPGGLFVLGDVVIPDDPADAQIRLTPGFDKPSTAGEQLAWMAEAGFAAWVSWASGDLAVIVAQVPVSA